MATATRTRGRDSIQNHAMVVTMKVSAFSGAKLDASVTREVAKRAQSIYSDVDGKDVGRYTKNLINPKFLKDIRKAGNAIRHTHYRLTLPWQDNQRLLPVKMVNEYRAEIDSLIDKFDDARADLVKNWQAIEDDAKQRLGTMFKGGEFPDAQSVAGLYRAGYRCEPIGDFGVQGAMFDGLAEDVRESIREDWESEIADRVESAQSDLWTRLHDALKHAAEKLSFDDDGEPQIFRDTLVTNIAQIAQIVPSLNITGNERIEKLAESSLELVERIGDVNSLRANHQDYEPATHDLVRDEVAAMADIASGYIDVEQ